MLRQKFVITALGVVVTAGVLGYVAFPDSVELNWMYWSSKSYKRSLEGFSKLYEEGNHSTSVLIPLAKSYLMNAMPEEAAKVYQEFVEAYPKDIQGRVEFAKIYKDLGLAKRYLASLQEIYQITQDSEMLQEILAYCVFLQDDACYYDTLKLIVETKKVKNKHFVSLAKEHAKRGFLDLAIASAERGVQEFGWEKQDSSLAVFLMHLYHKTGEPQLAYSTGKQFLEKNLTTDQFSGIAYTMIHLEMAEEALDLFDVLPMARVNNRELLDLKVSLLIELKKMDAVNELLTSIYSQGLLNQKLSEYLLEIAIDEKNWELASKLLTEFDFLLYPNYLQEKIAVMVLENDEKALSKALLEKINAHEQEQNSLLFFALTRASGGEISLPEMSGLKVPETISYLHILQVLKEKEAVASLLATLNDPSEIPEEQVGFLAFLFVDTGRYEEGWNLLSGHFKDPKGMSPSLLEGWITLSLYLGKAQEVQKWFASVENPSEGVLKAIYYAAEANHLEDFAASSVQKLFQLYPTNANQLLVIRSLIKQQDFLAAIELFKSLDSKELADSPEYLESLLKISKVDRTFEEELFAMVDQSDRTEKLEKIGEGAYQEQLLQVAEKSYLKLLAKDSKNIETKKSLGLIYFLMGKYRKSQCFLELFTASGKRDYLAEYYLGDIYRFYKIHFKANHYYWKAFATIARDPGITAEKSIVASHIMQNLGFTKQAVRMLSKTVERFPKESYIRLDLANLLIDIECKQRALQVLKEGDKELAYQLTLNRICESLAMSYCLIREHPDEAIAYQHAAFLELEHTRWRRSVCLLQKALELQRGSIPIQHSINDILYDHNSHLDAAYEFRRTGTVQKEHFVHSNVTLFSRCGTHANVAFHQDRVFLEDYIEPSSGLLRPFRGSRWRAEASLSHDFWNGGNLGATVGYNGRKIGGRVEGYSQDRLGRWIGFVDYHRPSWDLIQQTINYGTTDRFRLGRSFRIGKRLTTEWLGGWNRYNLDTVFSASSSYAILGNVRYTLYPHTWIHRYLGPDTSLMFTYTFDMERDTHIKQLPTADPNIFFPAVPSNTRELHTTLMVLEKTGSRCVYFRGFSGISYDRIQNIGGWVYGAALLLGKKEKPRITIDYSHTVSTDGTDTSVDAAIINLNVPF